MDKQAIFQKIKEVLDKQGIDTGNMDMSSDFEADLGLDSLDEVELMMALEEAFGQDIPDTDAQILKTVGDVISFMEGKIGQDEE